MNYATGRIDAHDIEELQYSVSPWDLSMRQMALGGLRANLEVVQLEGILLSREHWSHQVMAVGATPGDFVTIAGAYNPSSSPRWCGEAISTQTLIYGFGATDTRFVVPDGGTHWTVLVPKARLFEYLGGESAADVPRTGPILRCEAGLGVQLRNLVDRIMDTLGRDPESRPDELILEAIEAQLLSTIAEIVLSSNVGPIRPRPSRRHEIFRRAVRCAEDARNAVSVPELASRTGVSQRVLELSFRSELGISPMKFLRWSRMNDMHRDLRTSRKCDSSVTEIASRWGFTELGRTAGEYRRLFDESPLNTLSRETHATPVRLADTLAEPLGEAPHSTQRIVAM